MSTDDLADVVFPTWKHPFRTARSPFGEVVRDDNAAWSVEYGMVSEGRPTERYKNSALSECAAYLYPTASLEDLILLGRLFWWFFLLDDQFDEGNTGYNPDKADSVIPLIISILYGVRPPSGIDTPYHALHDLICSLAARMSCDWMKRFARGMSDYITSYAWETRNRAQARIPGLDEYKRMRRYTGGMYPTYDCIEVAGKIEIPYRIRECRWANETITVVNDIACWSNDVVSLPKESNHHRVNNLVHVLKKEHDCTVQEAVDEAHRMTEILYDRVAEMECVLPAVMDTYRCTPAERVDCEHWFELLVLCMAGSLDWQAEAGRYLPDKIETFAPGTDPSYLANLFASPIT